MTRLLRIKMAVAGVLGYRCRICGVAGFWSDTDKHDPKRLQVGHPNGRRWSIRRMNQVSRWLRYLKEALRSPRWCKKTHRFIPWVQAECGPCNRKHGGGLRYERREKSPRGGRS